MAINIQDNFKVNVSLPIDSRIVTANSTSRGQITNKYDGLSVFQLDDRKTYVWNAGTSTWGSSDITGAGETNFLSRFSSTFGLTSSAIFMVQGSNVKKGKIGINTNDPKEILQINTDTGTAQPFVIHQQTNSILALNWYNNGSDQYYNLNSTSSMIKFRSSDGSIIFLQRDAGSAALDSSDTFNSSIIARFTGSIVSLNKNLSMNNNNTQSGGALIIARSGTSTKTSPDYTWAGEANTGIYRRATNTIGFSIAGEQKMMLTSSGLLVSNNDTITAPNSRLQLVGASNADTALQITNGNTTNSSGVGLIVGLFSNGYAYIISKVSNPSRPLLFGIAANNTTGIPIPQFRMLQNKQFETILSSLDTIGSDALSYKIVRGGNLITWISGSSGATFNSSSLDIPDNSTVSIECTWNTTFTVSSTKYYLTSKKMALFKVNSGGSVSQQGTTANISEIASVGNGGSGIHLFAVASNQILMRFQAPTVGAGSGVSVASFTATINKFQGS